jgi:hypothetical protein
MNAQRNVNKKSTQTGDIRTENREPAKRIYTMYSLMYDVVIIYYVFGGSRRDRRVV